jgi:predicted MPP superfamily phosphohydrolase
MRFSNIQFLILSLSVVAQIYLFVCCRQFIWSCWRADRFKFRIIFLAGVTIGLLFAMYVYTLLIPIPWENPPLVARTILFYLPATWSSGAIFSALFLLLMRIAGSIMERTVHLYNGLRRRRVSLPLDLGRRRFLQATVGGLVAFPLVFSGYKAVHTSQAAEIRELTLPFGRSLRVVHLSDIHAGIYMTRKKIQHYVDQTIALQPDLLVLTGDFISNSKVFLPGCLEELARVKTRYGTFATLGNHEQWSGYRREVHTIFQQHRIPLLLNEHRVIQTESGPFAVAGIDDLFAGTPDLKAALHGIDSAIPTLLLSHRPEVFPQATSHGIPLTLAGHYHGGQIKFRLPGMDISLAHFLTPYPAGLYRINTSYLYVNRGIGTTFTPVRLNVPPEVTLLHLT